MAKNARRHARLILLEIDKPGTSLARRSRCALASWPARAPRGVPPNRLPSIHERTRHARRRQPPASRDRLAGRAGAGISVAVSLDRDARHVARRRNLRRRGPQHGCGPRRLLAPALQRGPGVLRAPAVGLFPGVAGVSRRGRSVVGRAHLFFADRRAAGAGDRAHLEAAGRGRAAIGPAKLAASRIVDADARLALDLPQQLPGKRAGAVRSLVGLRLAAGRDSLKCDRSIGRFNDPGHGTAGQAGSGTRRGVPSSSFLALAGLDRTGGGGDRCGRIVQGARRAVSRRFANLDRLDARRRGLAAGSGGAGGAGGNVDGRRTGVGRGRRLARVPGNLVSPPGRAQPARRSRTGHLAAGTVETSLGVGAGPGPLGSRGCRLRLAVSAETRPTRCPATCVGRRCLRC